MIETAAALARRAEQNLRRQQDVCLQKRDRNRCVSWLRDNESVLKVVPTWLRGWKPLTRMSARLELTAIIFLMNTALGYVVVFLGLIVNVTGSIAMGMLAAWFAFRGETTIAGA